MRSLRAGLVLANAQIVGMIPRQRTGIFLECLHKRSDKRLLNHTWLVFTGLICIMSDNHFNGFDVIA